MEYCGHDNYEPIETALKSVGFKVVYTEKHGNKKVITVTRNRQAEKVIKGRETIIEPQNE